MLSPKSCLAPLSRSLLQTSVEPQKAAMCRGVSTSPSLLLAALFGSAPLLSSSSAESQAKQEQARCSGVTWGGVWEGSLPHLFADASIIRCHRAGGVDDCHRYLLLPPLQLGRIYQCQAVKLSRSSRLPGVAPWCLDLIPLGRQLLTQGPFTSSCKFLIQATSNHNALEIHLYFDG